MRRAMRRSCEEDAKNALAWFHRYFHRGKNDFDGSAPLPAPDLHMAAEVGHPLADAAETHTLGSSFRAAFCFPRRHAFALIFDLEPDLLIGKR